MDDLQGARLYALSRVGLGLALVVAPRAVAAWLGPVARRPGTRLLTRLLGSRDAALGVGTLLALREAAPARRWLQLSAAVDATDAVWVLGAVRHLPARRTLPPAVLAAVGAATGAWLSGRLR